MHNIGPRGRSWRWPSNETTLGLSDILALDRTRLAAERALMGCIRRSFSMMTFDPTIFKIMQELGQLNTATLGPTRIKTSEACACQHRGPWR